MPWDPTKMTEENGSDSQNSGTVNRANHEANGKADQANDSGVNSIDDSGAVRETGRKTNHKTTRKPSVKTGCQSNRQAGRKIGKRAAFAITYGVVLVAFTGYVLFDTFALSRVQASASEINTSSIVASSTQGSSDATSSSSTSGKSGSSSNSSSSSSISSSNSSAKTTSTSYSDENMQISITTEREYDTNIYIVDVQVSSAEYLKTALANAQYGRNIKETTSEMAEDNNAVLAINGDYYGFRDDGYVIRNGVLYRSTASSGTDALVIYGDGTMASADEDEVSASQLLQDGAWQVLSFGPTLVENGQVVVGENAEVSQAKTSNPRTAIGMISPLHYVIVVSDGRTSESEGLSLYELAQVFEEQGCTYAYNLDGGGSTTLWFNGQIINNPTDGRSGGEREVSDIVYFG